MAVTLHREQVISLNEYQVANLRAAIEAAGFPDGASERNPLWVLNSGDWIGEVYFKLQSVDYRPNRTPEEYVAAARQFI